MKRDERRPVSTGTLETFMELLERCSAEAGRDLCLREHAEALRGSHETFLRDGDADARVARDAARRAELEAAGMEDEVAALLVRRLTPLRVGDLVRVVRPGVRGPRANAAAPGELFTLVGFCDPSRLPIGRAPGESEAFGRLVKLDPESLEVLV